MVFQKAQFEQQEEENRLIPGRTRVMIPSSVVTTDHGRQVVRYTIEVKQVDDNGAVMLGWIVARRYNEFWDLDQSLHGLARTELPPKRIVTNMSSSFIDTRRSGLERYLQSLVSSPIACDARPLQAFLSRHTVPLLHSSSTGGPRIVRSLYRTMASSVDETILGPSMLDVMYSSLNRQLSDIGSLIPDELRPAKAAKAEALTDGSFTTPICDFVIELFDLKENNWLRRQAIVVILQQLLGGTIER